MRALLISLGVMAIVGFIVMLSNFVERPTNDSGKDSFIGGRREWNPPWSHEQQRLMSKFRRWWEW
jgi:hypothetical protein